MTYNNKIMRHPESRQTIEKVMENGQTENGIITIPGKGQPPNSRGFMLHTIKRSLVAARHATIIIRRTYGDNGRTTDPLVRVSLQNRISQAESFLGERVMTLHVKTESSCYCFAR